jgi:hypothetical protein
MAFKRRKLTDQWYELELTPNLHAGIRCHSRGTWTYYYRGPGLPNGSEFYAGGYRAAVAQITATVKRLTETNQQ